MQLMKKQQKYSKDVVRQTNSDVIKIKLPAPDGKQTAVMKVDNTVPVHNNEEFAKGLFAMIAIANGQEKLNTAEQWMLLEACERHHVMPIEIYEAFWEAYGDEYVGKDGIQFKHLWKHIKKRRASCYRLPEQPETMEEYQQRKANKLQSQSNQ